MPKKRIESKEIERKVLKILLEGKVYMSINKTTEELERQYKIRLSPQVIKRYLLNLEAKGKIRRKE